MSVFIHRYDSAGFGMILISALWGSIVPQVLPIKISRYDADSPADYQ
jgi:hypothetical protein